MSGLDAHERPPEDLKAVFKHYQGISHDGLAQDTQIVHGDNTGTVAPCVSRSIHLAALSFEEMKPFELDKAEVPVLEWSDLPGLHFVPGLLPINVQLQLLDRMLHRDLANPQHQTNIHKHYKVPYDIANEGRSPDTASFFNADPSSGILFQPLDSTVHKPFTVSKFLSRKLRWMTLGGQYDWTEKVYPGEEPPEFPVDIASLIQRSFPEMVPQAAIVNVYSPGDTLALHRDVSEASDNGLVSVSIGCEAVFVVGLASESEATKWRAFLLRSGDAIYMSGPSRYAWHGVPKIFKNTCPESIRSWPAQHNSGHFEAWRDWMVGKRINLNVRQMFDNK